MKTPNTTQPALASVLNFYSLFSFFGGGGYTSFSSFFALHFSQREEAQEGLNNHRNAEAIHFQIDTFFAFEFSSTFICVTTKRPFPRYYLEKGQS